MSIRTKKGVAWICSKASLAMIVCFAGTSFCSAQEVNLDFDAAVRESLLRNPEVILEVFELLEAQQASAQQAEDAMLIANTAYRLFDGAGEAPVLVEFVDYQCGYCRQAQSQIEALLAEHPETQLRVVQLPILGDASLRMARIVAAIRELHGEEAYLTAHRAIMAGDGRLLQNPETLIESLGHDVESVMAKAETDEVQSQIAATQGLARELRISGTPGFVTRTDIIRGFADMQALEGAVFRFGEDG